MTISFSQSSSIKVSMCARVIGALLFGLALSEFFSLLAMVGLSLRLWCSIIPLMLARIVKPFAIIGIAERIRKNSTFPHMAPRARSDPHAKEPTSPLKVLPGHFKTNLAQGGTPEKAELTDEIEEIAVSTAEALGLFYGGIDIAESSSGQLFVLEANASPNWKGAEAMGLNPARKLVEEALKTGKA